jgi:hypothetical protein
MRSPLRIAAPLAVAASLAAVSPAVAASEPAARAAGTDAPAELTYPSIVQTRFDRTERALQRATKAIEKADPVAVDRNLKVVRRQMSSAWRGAKFIIRTTPPPPPPVDDAIGDPPSPATGPSIASPADSAYLVLYLQHEVASSMYQLIDGAHGTGLNAISRTMNFALDRRESALNDILDLAPPAPPPVDDRVHARAAQDDAPVIDTFDMVMPNYLPLLADEVQAIDGTNSDATDLTAGGRRLLTLAKSQVLRTQGFVNAHWPLLPPVDD